MCTQQTLTLPSNTSLENPSNIDNFLRLSKRQIVITVTGRGNAIKKTQHLATNVHNPNGKYFTFKLLVTIFMFQISILFY